MAKQRLDALLVEAGLFVSREKAKAAVMAGLVIVNGERADKPGTMLPPETEIALKGKPFPYVSRGGLKLEKALQVFALQLNGAVCIDIGASTGGFTDCMLQNGAVRVHAVDVGYGQLAWSLRNDARVVVHERTNFRHADPSLVGEMLDFASVDVSFISLRHMLPPARAMLKTGADMVCLIKPQFEAGREKVGKKGVVRDPAVHEEVIDRILELAKTNDFTVCGLSWSPIRGPEGNIEYLLWIQAGRETIETTGAPPLSFDVPGTVQAAHASFPH